MKRTISLLLALVLLLTLCGCGKKDRGAAWQEQYYLGVRYLSDGNYEEAIIAFTAAIEIDPKRAETYISLAETYIATDNFDEALAILQKGYDITSDEVILALLNNYQEPANLTGAEMFTFSDLDTWGYPYGSSMHDLAERGKCTQDDIKKVLHERSRYADADDAESVGFGISLSPLTFVDYNGKIMSVCIENGDPAYGPRGLHIGMSLYDVLASFYCENKDAIAYARFLDSELLPDQTTFFLYSNFDDTGLSGEDVPCFGCLRLADEEITVQYSIDELVTMQIGVIGGSVDRIEIMYRTTL